MTDKRIALLERAYAWFNEHRDLSKFFDAYDPDIELHLYGMETGVYRGKRATIDAWLWIREATEREEAKVLEHTDLGEGRILSVWLWRAVGQHSKAVIEREIAMIYTFRDVWIVRIDLFWDGKAEALKSLEAAEQQSDPQ